MLKDKKRIFLILLFIIILVISIIFMIGIISWNHKKINDNIYESDINSSYANKTIDTSSTEQEILPTYDLFNTYSLFNKKIIYNFGMGTYHEIDMPQIINDYEEIVIRDNLLQLSNNDYYVFISKDETLFENLPPEVIVNPGEIRPLYTIIFDDDTTKLFKVTYRNTAPLPDGVEGEDDVSYSLYRKDDNCTLKIEGLNKDELLKLLDLITVTNQSKTLEEQFYGITVLDERVIDTSKITISEIYNINNYLKIGINIDGKLIHINFLSENDETYLPTIKRLVDNWNLVAEKEDYKIYHGFTNSVQSDVLKVIKDDKEYFVDLGIPADLYTVQPQKNDNGSTSMYMYLSEELLKKIIDEIFNLF